MEVLFKSMPFINTLHSKQEQMWPPISPFCHLQMCPVFGEMKNAFPWERVGTQFSSDTQPPFIWKLSEGLFVSHTLSGAKKIQFPGLQKAVQWAQPELQGTFWWSDKNQHSSGICEKGSFPSTKRSHFPDNRQKGQTTTCGTYQSSCWPPGSHGITHLLHISKSTLASSPSPPPPLP